MNDDDFGGKSAQTKKRILDAAANVFCSRGYKSASLGEIASAASMKAGSLYFHFKSKDHLIKEVLREGVTRTHHSVALAVASLSAKSTAQKCLTAAILAHIDALRGNANYAAAVIRIVEEVSPEVRERFKADNRDYTDYWNRLIADAQRDGWFDANADPKLVRRILFGMMNAFDIRNLSTSSEAAAKAALLKMLSLDAERMVSLREIITHSLDPDDRE